MPCEIVGKRIASLRTDKKMTQKEFGELLGISRYCVGRVERGQKSIGDLIPVICGKIGVSADYIYFGKDDLISKIAYLGDFKSTEITIMLDILVKIAEIIDTTSGNDMMMKEVMRKQVV